MAVHHTRIVVAVVVAIALALFAACDPKKTVPKPTTGASSPVSEVMPRVGGPASVPR
jgi:hypothetical protein